MQMSLLVRGTAVILLGLSVLEGVGHAHGQGQEPALLVIGASYSNAATPFDDNLNAPLGGTSVNVGSYLSLGNALVREHRLPGFVINEGQAGATTFARLGCFPGPACGPAGWQSYETMFLKALARVTIPTNPVVYNAKYVVITVANDCLHSDAFGVPQSQTTECTTTDVGHVVDRYVALGLLIRSKGLIPIYDVYPSYDDLNFPLFRSLVGLNWVIGRTTYELLRNSHRTRIAAQVPGAVVLDIWKDFVDIGDGLHPNAATAARAARRIADKIHDLEDGT